MKARVIFLLVLVGAMTFVMGMWFCQPIQMAVDQKVLLEKAPSAPSVPETDPAYTVDLDGHIYSFYPLSEDQILAADEVGNLTLYAFDLGAMYGYNDGAVYYALPMN